MCAVWNSTDKPLPSTSVTLTSMAPSQNAAQGDAHTDPAQTRQRFCKVTGQVTSRLVSLRRSPFPEPSVLNGDPLAYLGWKSSFPILIDERNILSGDRIHYLKRYISSPFKDVNEGYLLIPSGEAYEEA